MKKLMLLVGVVCIISVTACKKDYTCKCTSDDTSGFITDLKLEKMKKKDAEAACKDWETISKVFDADATCKI